VSNFSTKNIYVWQYKVYPNNAGIPPEFVGGIMTLFDWFLVAHVIGDFLLQTDTEANQKMHGSIFNWPLWRHVSKYTAVCATPLFLHGLSLLWLLPIFISHLFFDRRWPIIWWRKHVMRNSEASIAKNFWLTIVVDQIFHILVLVAITVIASK